MARKDFVSGSRGCCHASATARGHRSSLTYTAILGKVQSCLEAVAVFAATVVFGVVDSSARAGTPPTPSSFPIPIPPSSPFPPSPPSLLPCVCRGPVPRAGRVAALQAAKLIAKGAKIITLRASRPGTLECPSPGQQREGAKSIAHRRSRGVKLGGVVRSWLKRLQQQQQTALSLTSANQRCRQATPRCAAEPPTRQRWAT